MRAGGANQQIYDGGRLAAGAAAAVASSSAAASDMAVGSVYIIYKYWGRVLEQHVLPHGRAPTAPDGANFQTEKWTVFQVQQLHPSKYIYVYTVYNISIYTYIYIHIYLMFL